MRYRLTFITGLAVGYVLGTKAGRERYEQLRAWAQQVTRNPAVRNTAESAGQTGGQIAAKARDRVRALRERREKAGVSGACAEDDWGSPTP
jgi:hypothetical protein